MARRWLAVFVLFASFSLPTLAQASTEDLRTIIERFVVGEFPSAIQHYWIINETQWEGDEMVVDMHTIVQEKRQVAPILNRFLLLIVAGELKGAQQVALEPGADCQPEQET